MIDQRDTAQMREAIEAIFAERVDLQAKRVGESPIETESPGTWRDRVRQAAILSLPSIQRREANALNVTEAVRLRARELLAAEYEAAADAPEGAGTRFHAANVRVIGKRNYADWKDHAALRAIEQALSKEVQQ